ncbi:unnamed protein product [Urochloa humidicola]
MASATDNGWSLPTDAFVEILLRLPTTKRWRLRLVCRHWRDVIRDRTPAPPQPTALVFVVSCFDGTPLSASAYAIDDLAGGRCREVWRSSNAQPAGHFDQTRNRYVYARTFDMAMVGTRNGVLCLCDNKTPGGAISLANPATGETLALPPLPCSRYWQTWGTTISKWHEAYAFAYDPDTEKYWVVHVPSFFDRNGAFAALQVFTVPGDEGPSRPASWREVPVAGAAASCRLDAGLVTIDGALHWVTDGTERVVSFDLEVGRVMWTLALPAGAGRGYWWNLTEVHGRLAAINCSVQYWWDNPKKTHVWVLDGGGGGRNDRRRGWSRRYSSQVQGGVYQRLAAPQFAYGEHVVTTEAQYRNPNWKGVFVHRMPPGRLLCGEVRSVLISGKSQGVRVSGIVSVGDANHTSILGVFAYVETKEPLGISQITN